jgi:carbon-monoxide dehydrogenase large subunit
MAYAAMVRAPHAHARIVSIDTQAARAGVGVVAVLTARDAAADGLGDYLSTVDHKGPGGRSAPKTPRPFLVGDVVRFAGEPVAMVVADSLDLARDAAEAVVVEYEPRPAVANAPAALAAGAPAIWEDAPDNIAFVWSKGDAAELDAALKASHHVTSLSSVVSRVAAMPIEPRAAVGVVSPDGRLILHASHQTPFNLRRLLAAAFQAPPEKVRVIVGDVGGSFGMKGGLMREDALVLWAARRLGRPVRWASDRAEAFLSDEHARDAMIEATLGLDADGRFTALRVEYTINIGAYLSGRSQSHLMNFGGIAGVYRIPTIVGAARAVFTNTQPTAPYRGAGRPDATYAVERIIDVAARELGLDPFELRRRNLIPADAMPYKTAFLFAYDCGDFGQCMREAGRLADYAGFAARREDSRRRGRLRGIGVANPIEVAAGPFRKVSTDHARIRIHRDGGVTLDVGTMSTGQGLETALPEIVGQRLGIPSQSIRYVQGDTDALADGKGSGGSAALSICGGAVSMSVDGIIARGRELAVRELGGNVSEIAFAAGLFRRRGSNRALSLAELAEVAERGDPAGFFCETAFTPAAPTYPNGCHVCEVEIDPETGELDVVAYVSVEDVGRVMSPVLVEGQIHGGVAQGIGQAIKEMIVHAPDSAQLLAGSFTDYAMPLASDIPAIACGNVEVPTALNPLGVKGVGEAGTVGALSAAMNAVCDALAALGIRHFDMPATPGRLWQAIRSAGSPPAGT